MGGGRSEGVNDSWEEMMMRRGLATGIKHYTRHMQATYTTAATPDCWPRNNIRCLWGSVVLACGRFSQIVDRGATSRFAFASHMVSSSNPGIVPSPASRM